MELLDFVLKVLLGIALGALVGSERERMLRQRFAGIRTFALIALFGAFIGLFTFFPIPLVEFFPILGLFAVTAYTYYIFRSVGIQMLGMTTLVVVPLVYLIGLLVGFGYSLQAISATFIMLAVLMIGRALHRRIESLTEEEINEVIQFGILLFVLFPLIPKEPVVINGFVLDFVVLFAFIILVSLINFFAFLSSRMFRHTSAVFTGFLGGIVNSTATLFLMTRSRERGWDSEHVPAATATILGSTVRNFVLLALIIPSILLWMLPLMAACILILFAFIFKERRHLKMRLTIEQPFSVLGGVKLAGALFVCVLFFQFISTFLPSYLAPASLLGGAVSSAYTIVSLGLLSLTVNTKTLLISAVAAMIGSYSVSAGVAKFYGKKRFGDSVLLQTGLLILASAAYITAVILFF